MQSEIRQPQLRTHFSFSSLALDNWRYLLTLAHVEHEIMRFCRDYGFLVWISRALRGLAQWLSQDGGCFKLRCIENLHGGVENGGELWTNSHRDSYEIVCLR